MPKPDPNSEPLDLGQIGDDYVNDDAIIEAEQAAGPHASCTSLMTWLYRLFVPNRWPKY